MSVHWQVPGAFSAIAHELLMLFIKVQSNICDCKHPGEMKMKITVSPRTRLLNGWRIAGWGSVVGLLLLPAFAMQFTNEVQWTLSDFVFAAILLGFLATVIELAARFARPGSARVGYVIAGIAAFITFWSNAAVGIIGDENSVNVFFFLVMGASILAGAIVRFRPGAMRWIAAILAIAQYVIGIAALYIMPGHAVEWGFLSFFAALWFTAASCFHRAFVK